MHPWRTVGLQEGQDVGERLVRGGEVKEGGVEALGGWHAPAGRVQDDIPDPTQLSETGFSDEGAVTLGQGIL